MTPEQKKAVDLATEIGKLGGYVVSLVPPSQDDLIIRFQLEVAHEEFVLGELKGWGWSPERTGGGMRFHVLGHTTPVSHWMIKIPLERVPVQDDGKSYFGELSKGKKAPTEADLIATGLGKK